MRILDILQDKDLPKEPAEPVEKVTQEIKDLCIDMCIAMKNAQGIGISAPQVGVNKRIIIVNAITYSEANFCTFMINPEILEVRGKQSIKEGCLSFPGQFIDIVRSQRVTVKYQNTQGETLIQNFSGLAAQVIQHECDHLNGLTMYDEGGYKL